MAKIEEGIESIKAHSVDRYELDLDTLRTRIESLEAIEVTEEIFQEHIESAKAYQEEGLMKLRVTLRSAEERAEEDARLEKQRQEQEAEEKRLREEREAFEQEKREREEAEAQERARKQAEEDARLAKEREELEAKQREIDEREAQERKALEEQQAEAARLAAAPDVEKLEVFANFISNLSMPGLKTDAGQRVIKLTQERLEGIAEYLLLEADKMK